MIRQQYCRLNILGMGYPIVLIDNGDSIPCTDRRLLQAIYKRGAQLGEDKLVAVVSIIWKVT